jgi:hypothetical protein
MMVIREEYIYIYIPVGGLLQLYVSKVHNRKGIQGKKKRSQNHKRHCFGDTQNRRLIYLL